MKFFFQLFNKDNIMKLFLFVFTGFILFVNFQLLSQEDFVKVAGRYGECYKKTGFDSYSENQPQHTWGFKNVEIYEKYIFFYDAAYPGQHNNFLILNKDDISRFAPNNEGNFTEIYTKIESGTDTFMRITLRSTGSHDKFVSLLIN